ncbi:MAG TPA: dinitrogenase iron-molybdenum cofactor biosynthesis protein [Candidatus Hydrogenedentes bacterium]|nr:dinitrogenase iron-molybdenum cofactor biosynthesis protein [Candidatus Hydrogenedentota bacterium]
MKVAVTAQGPDLSSAVDPRVGRAACFIVVDTETGEHITHDNVQNLEAAQGAGIQASRQVIDFGAEALITGNLGPKAFAVLKSAGVKVYLAPAVSVLEAVEQLKAGELECSDGANVEGHWV